MFRIFGLWSAIYFAAFFPLLYAMFGEWLVIWMCLEVSGTYGSLARGVRIKWDGSTKSVACSGSCGDGSTGLLALFAFYPWFLMSVRPVSSCFLTSLLSR